MSNREVSAVPLLKSLRMSAVGTVLFAAARTGVGCLSRGCFVAAMASGLFVGGLTLLALHHFETVQWSVVVPEQLIADRVRQLGGAYNKHGGNYRRERMSGDDELFGHISSVQLQGTAASDEDLRFIMQLRFLESLDIRDTLVTDASVDLLGSQGRLREIWMVGSKISPEGRRSLIEACDRQNRTIVVQ